MHNNHTYPPLPLPTDLTPTPREHYTTMAKRSPANDYMSDVHSMDYSVLDFGKGPVSKETVHLVDLDVHVHGLREIEGGQLPVAIIVSWELGVDW
jgi:hypothetical protein